IRPRTGVMPVARELRCPTCRTRFPAPKSGASRTKCPGCGEELEVELPPEDAPRTLPLRKKRVGVVDLDDEVEDERGDPEPEPEPRSRPRRRRRSSGWSGGGRRVLLGVGGVVVVLLVLGGVGWGVWRVARGEPEFKEFSPPGGNFTVLMPGDPSKKGVGFGGL